jgi:hypothetical protein
MTSSDLPQSTALVHRAVRGGGAVGAHDNRAEQRVRSLLHEVAFVAVQRDCQAAR